MQLRVELQLRVASCNLQLSVAVRSCSRALTAGVASLVFMLLTLNQPQPYSASFFSEFTKPVAYMPPKYTHP